VRKERGEGEKEDEPRHGDVELDNEVAVLLLVKLLHSPPPQHKLLTRLRPLRYLNLHVPIQRLHRRPSTKDGSVERHVNALVEVTTLPREDLTRLDVDPHVKVSVPPLRTAPRRRRKRCVALPVQPNPHSIIDTRRDLDLHRCSLPNLPNSRTRPTVAPRRSDGPAPTARRTSRRHLEAALDRERSRSRSAARPTRLLLHPFLHPATVAGVAIHDRRDRNGAGSTLRRIDERHRDGDLDIVSNGRGSLTRTGRTSSTESAKERVEDVGSGGSTGSTAAHSAAEEVAEPGAAEGGGRAGVGVRVEAGLLGGGAETVEVGTLLIVREGLQRVE
jgi:hypothetical protein